MSVREQIVAAIKQALAGVGTVHLWRPPNWSLTELPLVILRDTSAEVSGGAEIGRFTHSLTVEIEVQASAATGSTATAATSARTLLESVCTVVGNNPNWSGLALRSRITRHEIAVDQAEATIGGGQLTLVVEYRTAAYQM